MDGQGAKSLEPVASASAKAVAPVALKYRAFISYSHADTAWAKWLHRGLESFRIDKDLVGRETETGTIPKTLHPIFRDRDDFTAGHTLTEQTLAALDASAALIVICSPAAAKSHYVNEEIRLFKSRHPERPVIPLIVDGKPGDPELECFPPALKFKLDAKGRIGKSRSSCSLPMRGRRATARSSRSPRSLPVFSVCPPTTSSAAPSASAAERQRCGTASSPCWPFFPSRQSAAPLYAWQQLKTNEAFLYATLGTATGIVDDAVAQAEQFGVPRSATLALLTKAEGLFDNMACLAARHPSCAIRRLGC